MLQHLCLLLPLQLLQVLPSEILVDPLVLLDTSNQALEQATPLIQVLPYPLLEEKQVEKRGTLLMDKIMTAVQKALDENKSGGAQSGLERRGSGHDRVYW